MSDWKRGTTIGVMRTDWKKRKNADALGWDIGKGKVRETTTASTFLRSTSVPTETEYTVRPEQRVNRTCTALRGPQRPPSTVTLCSNSTTLPEGG